MGIRITAEREIEDPRLEVASTQPHRRNLQDPLSPLAESSLGRMRLRGIITEPEYDAGCRWRNIYLRWLRLMENAPWPFPTAIDNSLFACGTRVLALIEAESDDEQGVGLGYQRTATIFTTDQIDHLEEIATKAFKAADAVLMKLGHRVRDSVNAIAVYEEPEELGDFDRISKAAKIGLAALAEHFG